MPHKDDLDAALAGLLSERERNPYAEAVRALSEPAALTAYLCDERETLLARLRALSASQPPGAAAAPPGGLAMARAFSDLMDALIQQMFALACRRVGADPAKLPITIVATGGYGRRELSPFSDIDITFIPQHDGNPLVDTVIREMFTQLMDICITRCGLEVGYAYRLMEDCGALDHQTICGLLDARFVAGSERLFIQFEDTFWTAFNAADFLFTKLAERRKALEKWGRSPRVVEPQLKEGPGGLRDLQTAIWTVQAQQHLVAARARGDRAFRLLTEEANVSTVDALRLKEAKEQLFRVRNALHALSNAERDQLVITRQEEIAALLGYGEGETPPVERFMAALYQDMALIRRVAEQVMRRMENSRLILGIGLDCRRRQIVPANDALESDDPVWLLWACELAQKYELEFGERLETAAVALVATNPVLPEPHLAAQVFTRLLSQTGRVYPILQKMADLGILGWYLPEFGAVLDLIPYDPSHDYTVGQHSLLVIRQLDALLEPGGSEERAEMRRALLELAHPEQLMLAALLHDCGKADPNRPHSEVSEELAIRVCARLGWSEEATANVRFLAREHLVMSETSRLRDLSQEETVRDFTQLVGDLERLNMLYLLTYADTSAVGAGVWTQVMARFLRELWQRAAAVLSDEEPLGYDEAAIARARRRLLKDLAPENLPEEEVAEHTQAMPAHYLLNQSLSQIALHIGYVRQVRAGSPVIDFHNERDATYTELTVCTYDDPQPGLLAKIAAVLYAADLDVHSAQVITRVTERDRIALDTLWVDYRGRQLSPGKRREVEQNLRAVLAGTRSASELLAKRRARPTHHEAAEAGRRLSARSIRHDLSETLTVIETVSPDGQGALYWPAEAFSRLGWDIHSARVSRFRAETISSFYVSGARGLSEEQARHAIQEALPVASVS